VGRGTRVGVDVGVAVAVRVGHAAVKGGRSLAAGAGGGVAPSPVSALVLGHFRLHADGREGRVLVGVESILLNFFPARLLCTLLRLALPPEPESGEQQQCDGDDRNDDGDSRLAGRAQAASFMFVLGILKRSCVGRADPRACWRHRIGCGIRLV
jgi:hypothetical protein